MIALRAQLGRFGIAVLDATTRTWGAFWGTLAVWGFYWAWNSRGALAERFDPYPFVFLTLLITMASYLQNIVLMTDQRQAALEMAVLRRKQEDQDRRMLHMLEAVTAASDLLIRHASLVDRRDLQIIEMLKRVADGDYKEADVLDGPASAAACPGVSVAPGA